METSIDPKSVIKQYIYKGKGVPVGLLMSARVDGTVKIVGSLCKKPDKFSKTRATELCMRRLKTPRVVRLHPSLHRAVKSHFYDRCCKYYKDEKVNMPKKMESKKNEKVLEMT